LIKIVLEQLFHACDIGNPCVDYENYVSWAALLSFEFDQQARYEKEIGVDISPNFTYTGLLGFYKGQMGFISKINDI
jgi:cAMP-specific phosphodiesterase 4